VAEFNRRHAHTGVARIDTLEAKAGSGDAIQDTMHLMPSDLQAYFEIPIDRDPTSLVATLGRVGARAASISSMTT